MCRKKNKSLMFTLKKETSHYLLTLLVIEYWHLSFISNKTSLGLQSRTTWKKKPRSSRDLIPNEIFFFFSFFSSGSRWPAWSCFFVSQWLRSWMRQHCLAVILFQKVFAQGETLCGGSASIRASYDDLILFKNKHQAPVAVRNKS